MSLQNIEVDTKEVSFTPYKSNLKLDYASGVGAITIYSIADFAINQILLIGEYGSEGSEIIKTHASTTPTGFTVTLVSNLAKPHSKDAPVYILDWDQIEFSHAETLAGAKSVLGSIQNINPEDAKERYNDAVNTSGYYFTRYYNSITSVYSEYSDGIPALGLPTNTVGYAINRAMDELNVPFSEKLTFEMVIGFARQMLSLVRGKLRSWSKYQEYDYVVGQVGQATTSYAMPETVYDQNSNKSIPNLRIEDLEPLTYVDRSEYIRMITEDDGNELNVPEFYSTWEGNIYLWPLGDDTTEGLDLLMDFYTDIETIDSQMDVIKGTKADMLVPYLKFKIRAIVENNGKEDLRDPSYQEFRELLNDAVKNDGGAEIHAFRPRRRVIYGGRTHDSNR